MSRVVIGGMPLSDFANQDGFYLSAIKPKVEIIIVNSSGDEFAFKADEIKTGCFKTGEVRTAYKVNDSVMLEIERFINKE